MTKTKTNPARHIGIAVCIAALIGLDQLTKYLAVLFLKGKNPVSLIPAFWNSVTWKTPARLSVCFRISNGYLQFLRWHFWRQR